LLAFKPRSIYCLRHTAVLILGCIHRAAASASAAASAAASSASAAASAAASATGELSGPLTKDISRSCVSASNMLQTGRNMV
jgi:hypothetical protein